ncbi:MAG: L-threonylcarbamoyladenylate synthase [Negativicoccus succinicivorans]|nr:L-threonylcarbamoyladenylate synthase [Negativicoccus succinicivorans]
MKTKYVTIDHSRPLGPQVAPWGEILRAGGLVAFPTETVYGLGANGLDSEAAKKIYVAKGRPSDNPLILHVLDRDGLAPLVKEIPPLVDRLISEFWPGPLTLVLPKSDIVPTTVTGGGETVAVRAPSQAVARALIAAAGVPLAAPSANLSGRPSPVTAPAVRHDLDGRVDAILDDGACRIGLESTVVSLQENELVIYRPGAITLEMLSAFAPTRLDSALVTGQGIPKAPGMKYRHYAPRVPVYLYTGETEKIRAALAKTYDPRRGYLVSAETSRALPAGENIYIWGDAADAAAYAAHLYQGLLYLDETAAEEIYAEGVSDQGIGLAVMNRLLKAAAYQVREVK